MTTVQPPAPRYDRKPPPTKRFDVPRSPDCGIARCTRPATASTPLRIGGRDVDVALCERHLRGDR